MKKHKSLNKLNRLTGKLHSIVFPTIKKAEQTIDNNKSDTYQPSSNTTTVNFSANRTVILNFLVFSVLYALLNRYVAPLFWEGLDNRQPSNITNYLLGIAGLLGWLIDPFAWYYYSQIAHKRSVGYDEPTTDSESVILGIFKSIMSIVIVLVLLIPGTFAWILRPAIRALILMISVNLLSPSVGYNNPFLVLLIVADIALFYINNAAPEWKYNPMKYIYSFLNNLRFGFKGVVATVAYMIQSVLYFSIFQATAAYAFHKTADTSLLNLSFFWLLAVVFSQFPYLASGGEDVSDDIDNIPVLGKWLLALSFIVSYFSFMYPYFFSQFWS